MNATGESFSAPTGTESTSSYTVKVTNSCGVYASAPKTVIVLSDFYFSNANADADKPKIEVGVPVGFTYTGPNADYRWDFGDNTFANTR
ncbi:MAG: hypothetical protein CRN43_21995, partial [Candidatus Nephrothrix sp. EaCA]